MRDIQTRMTLSKLRDREGGVTLIELMITVVVLSVLLAMGMPAMARFINDIRVSNATNEFVNALNTARSEAIRRGRLVSVCQSDDPTAGVPACDAGSDWATGWIVFVESSAAGDNSVSSENVISRRSRLPNNVNAQANLSRAITFNATGEPIGNFAGITLNFNYAGGCARSVAIGRSGRVTVTPDGTPCGS